MSEPAEMVERICRAMHDCHERDEHSMTWDDWLAEAAHPDENRAENGREWVEARRKEARAALEAMRPKERGEDIPGPIWQALYDWGVEEPAKCWHDAVGAALATRTQGEDG